MQLKQTHISKYTVEKHVVEKPDAGPNVQHKAWLWLPHQWLQIHLFDDGAFLPPVGGKVATVATIQNQLSAFPMQARILISSYLG